MHGSRFYVGLWIAWPQSHRRTWSAQQTAALLRVSPVHQHLKPLLPAAEWRSNSCLAAQWEPWPAKYFSLGTRPYQEGGTGGSSAPDVEEFRDPCRYSHFQMKIPSSRCRNSKSNKQMQRRLLGKVPKPTQTQIPPHNLTF